MHALHHKETRTLRQHAGFARAHGIRICSLFPRGRRPRSNRRFPPCPAHGGVDPGIAASFFHALAATRAWVRGLRDRVRHREPSLISFARRVFSDDDVPRVLAARRCIERDGRMVHGARRGGGLQPHAVTSCHQARVRSFDLGDRDRRCLSRLHLRASRAPITLAIAVGNQRRSRRAARARRGTALETP